MILFWEMCYTLMISNTTYYLYLNCWKKMIWKWTLTSMSAFCRAFPLMKLWSSVEITCLAAELEKKELNSCNKFHKLSLIHNRLGHVSVSKMKHLDFCKCENLCEHFYNTCGVAKHHKLPFMHSKSIAVNIFELIHVDLWGPYRRKTIAGGSYFLILWMTIV